MTKETPPAPDANEAGTAAAQRLAISNDALAAASLANAAAHPRANATQMAVDRLEVVRAHAEDLRAAIRACGAGMGADTAMQRVTEAEMWTARHLKLA